MGQRPQANETQGIGKGIEQGDSGIGPSVENIVGGSPEDKEGGEHVQIQNGPYMGDGHFLIFALAFLLAEFPHGITVDGRYGVVACHASIAVESMTVVEVDVECRHDDAHEP